MNFQKQCRVCGTIYNEEGWRALPLLDLRDEGEGLYLEMRNCPCHATLALEVRGTMALRLLADEAEKILKTTRSGVASITREILSMLELPKSASPLSPDAGLPLAAATCDFCARPRPIDDAHFCELCQ